MHVVVWRCLQERLLAAAMVDDGTLYLHSSDRPFTFTIQESPWIMILRAMEQTIALSSDLVTYICRSNLIRENHKNATYRKFCHKLEMVVTWKWCMRRLYISLLKLTSHVYDSPHQTVHWVNYRCQGQEMMLLWPKICYFSSINEQLKWAEILLGVGILVFPTAL